MWQKPHETLRARKDSEAQGVLVLPMKVTGNWFDKPQLCQICRYACNRHSVCFTVDYFLELFGALKQGILVTQNQNYGRMHDDWG